MGSLESCKTSCYHLKSWEIMYGPDNEDEDMVGCTDANGNLIKDHHAISGYAFLLNGGPISWSIKQ